MRTRVRVIISFTFLLLVGHILVIYSTYFSARLGQALKSPQGWMAGLLEAPGLSYQVARSWWLAPVNGDRLRSGLTSSSSPVSGTTYSYQPAGSGLTCNIVLREANNFTKGCRPLGGSESLVEDVYKTSVFFFSKERICLLQGGYLYTEEINLECFFIVF